MATESVSGHGRQRHPEAVAQVGEKPRLREQALQIASVGWRGNSVGGVMKMSCEGLNAVDRHPHERKRGEHDQRRSREQDQLARMVNGVKVRVKDAPPFCQMPK